MSTSRNEGSRLLKHIDVYPPESPLEFDLNESTRLLASLFPTAQVEVRSSVFKGVDGRTLRRIAGRIARSRVRNPRNAEEDFGPLQAEVEYELRVIRGRTPPGGIVYNSRRYTDAVLELLDSSVTVDRASVLVTNRLVSTYSSDDLQHHLRTVVFGFPSVVSIPGVVEAPAKPREYYLMKREMEGLGASALQLKQLRDAFKDRFLDHGDPRISQVVGGLLAQAILFHLTLKPFCDDRTCRFFNAHWQEDLIRSQLGSAGICPRHSKLLARLRRKPIVGW